MKARQVTLIILASKKYPANYDKKGIVRDSYSHWISVSAGDEWWRCISAQSFNKAGNLLTAYCYPSSTQV